MKIESRPFTRSKEKCWKKRSHTIGPCGGKIANTKRHLAYMRAKHRSSNTGIFHNTLQLLTRDGGAFDSPKSLRTPRTTVGVVRRTWPRLAEDVVNFCAFFEASDALLPKKTDAPCWCACFRTDPASPLWWIEHCCRHARHTRQALLHILSGLTLSLIKVGIH